MRHDTGVRKVLHGLNTRENRRDILSLFVAPLVLLIGIFLIPESAKALEFKARNPTLVGILGSNLAHRSVSHIGGNLIGFWGLGCLSLALMRRTDTAHIYRRSFVVYLLILPFVASWSIIRMFSDNPEMLATYESVGFSLTVAAVAGFLAIAIATYYADQTGQQDSKVTALGVFSLGFAVAVYNLGTLGDVGLLLGAFGVLTLLYMGYRMVVSFGTVTDPRISSVAAAILFFASAILFLFPESAPGGIFGHMAGYVWGFFLPITGLWVASIYRQMNGGEPTNPPTTET